MGVPKLPALLKSRSRRPCSAVVRSKRLSTCSGELTSVGTMSASSSGRLAERLLAPARQRQAPAVRLERSRDGAADPGAGARDDGDRHLEREPGRGGLGLVDRQLACRLPRRAAAVRPRSWPRASVRRRRPRRSGSSPGSRSWTCLPSGRRRRSCRASRRPRSPRCGGPAGARAGGRRSRAARRRRAAAWASACWSARSRRVAFSIPQWKVATTMSARLRASRTPR